MIGNPTLITYFGQAGLVVKSVMLILMTASVVSWTIIIQRWLFLSATRQKMHDFEQEFWSGVELSSILKKLERQKPEGITNIFYAGYNEYARAQQASVVDPKRVQEGVQRAMHIAYSREVDKLELHLPFLASVGSISPYVGLFGTVWGIMASLQALGNAQQATISMVAPGISEALIATAMGLFAAIPAVLAYNRFSNTASRIMQSYETFQEEFTNIIQREG